MKVNNFLIGGDIEVFLMHKQTKEIVSAEGIIKGEKHNPFNFDPSSPFFATSLDNVMAEYTLPPVTDVNAWLKNIQKSMDYINSIVPEELCTVALPAARLDEKWLDTENARLFGCSPDFCVWTRSVNEKPAAEGNLRSAGFHVHVGYDNPIMDTNEQLIKALDLFLSVPGVLIEPENERKKLYGKAGCFRVPNHGIEYRSLSGYYASKPELSKWVFNNTERAIQFVNDERMDEIDAVGELIQAAINGNDATLASNLIRQFDLELV